jgi:putative DNA primase/helicase
MSEKETAPYEGNGTQETQGSVDPGGKDNNFFTENASKEKLFADTGRLMNSKPEMPDPLRQKATELLGELLMDIQPVDFDKIINPTGDTEKKPTYAKRYVIVGEKLIELAQSKQWGVCQNGGFVYLYNGACWQALDDKVLKLALKKAAQLMGIDEYLAKQSNVGDRLLKEFYDTGFQQMPETNKVLINLQNGTLEICEDGTFKLRKFRPEDFLRYQLPFDYNPDAECQQWQAFLDKVLPDKQSQTVLAEALGSVFIKTGNLKLEKAVVLKGFGANGKSVVFDVVGALLGRENMLNYSIGSLCEESGYFRAGLQNALVNYSSELGSGRQFNSDRFKQLCSGEPLEARLLYKDAFTIRNYARLFFNVNILPRNVEHTDAFFRRFLLIPFNVTIPPEMQDKKLAQKIIATELPGVLNWALAGLKRVVRQEGFSECKASEEALEQYKVESNTVLLFLQENEYQPSDTGREERKKLYEEYKNFCFGDGHKVCSAAEFYSRLKSAGYRLFIIHGKRYIGIEKLPESAQDVDTDNINEQNVPF